MIITFNHRQMQINSVINTFVVNVAIREKFFQILFIGIKMLFIPYCYINVKVTKLIIKGLSTKTALNTNTIAAFIK